MSNLITLRQLETRAPHLADKSNLIFDWQEVVWSEEMDRQFSLCLGYFFSEYANGKDTV